MPILNATNINVDIQEKKYRFIKKIIFQLQKYSNDDDEGDGIEINNSIIREIFTEAETQNDTMPIIPNETDEMDDYNPHVEEYTVKEQILFIVADVFNVDNSILSENIISNKLNEIENILENNKNSLNNDNILQFIIEFENLLDDNINTEAASFLQGSSINLTSLSTQDEAMSEPRIIFDFRENIPLEIESQNLANPANSISI